ncbi:MAG: CHAT domain-containing protein [Saprospiraceae bacterium]
MRLLLFTLTLLLGLGGCAYQSAPYFPATISDPYISVDGFQLEDQLRYQQNYEQAAIAYATQLATAKLSLTDSLYAINQIAYCHLMINKTDRVQEWLDKAGQLIEQVADFPRSLLSDWKFNKGRYYFLQNQADSALIFTHEALKLGYSSYPKGHLKTAQTLSLLSLIHLKDGNLTDSIHYYALQANDVFLNHPELSPYDWEHTYVQGYASLLYRAHERGEYYCRATLQKLTDLPFENKWLEVRTYNLLANMLKKRSDGLAGEDQSLLEARQTKLYVTADSLFQKAIAIGKANQDAELMVFYIDWIINCTRFSDSTYFFQAMNAFEEQFSGSEDWRAHYDRLLGYYYFAVDTEKTIRHYSAFLEAKENDPEIDYRLLADSYYCLRVAHRTLNDFVRSAQYAKKSFLLYDCLSGEVDITQVDNIQQIDSTKRYCLAISGFFAEGLLKKYQLGKDPEDLNLANAYYGFIERHSFRSLLSKDEDAFLSFQYEAGGKIYAKALEAAHETWKLTQDKHWLEKAFNYMEYLKSFLLYRDMLKEPVSEDTYSLSDSIRLLQGQVNQLLFALRTGGQKVPNEGYNNQLVNTLNQLEHQRSEKLNTFETDIYRNLISLKEIQQNLAPKQGVVNYYNSSNQLFGIYIDKDTALFFQPSIAYALLTANIQVFRESIEKEVKLDEITIRRYLTSAKLLYQALIQPFAKQLNSLDQILIIPDQLLDPITFEALLSEEVDSSHFSFKNLPYFLHQVQIVYTSSWKTYQANRRKTQAHFDKPSIGFWTTPELITTNGLQVIEQSIQSSFGDNYRIFSQSKGGKKLFAESHSQFDILHLLLHASSSKIDRYDNYIRFGQRQDDLIYGFEFYQEKFRAKLAVMASCESATGASQSGEGTFSLARSFINSGIPEIVAAQFLIPQTTTGPLLSHFYQYLGKGYDAAEALHLAKIAYLKSVDKERHAYPRFWAGMVVFN